MISSKAYQTNEHKDIPELLADFHRRDVRLWAEAGRLRYKAPKGALTTSMRQVLRERRRWLLPRS